MIKTHLRKVTHFTGRLVFSVLMISMLMVGLLPVAPVQAAGLGSKLMDTFADAGVSGYTNYALVNTTYWAQSFRTTATANVLTEIDLNLFRISPTDTAGDYNVWLYQSNGTAPYFPTTLQALSPISGGPLVFLPQGTDYTDGFLSIPYNTTLAANTTYFVVVQITGVTAGNVHWGYTPVCTTCVAAGAMGEASYQTFNGGSGWFNPSYTSDPFVMTVYADGACTTAAAGDWSTVGTWDCNRVPTGDQKITVNHAVSLSADVGINAELQLNADVTTGAKTLSMQSSATINPTSLFDIVGTVRRPSPASGVALQFNNAYTTIQFTNSLLTSMDITLAKGPVANWGTGRVVPRTYTLTPSAETFDAATVQLAYQPADIPALATESKFVLWRYTGTGTNWANMGRTGVVDTTNHFVALTGVTAFSPWTISDVTPTAVTLNNLSAASALPGSAIAVVTLAALLVVALAGLRLRTRRTASQPEA